MHINAYEKEKRDKAQLPSPRNRRKSKEGGKQQYVLSLINIIYFICSIFIKRFNNSNARSHSYFN
jgi:hypothetical protein